VKNVPNSTNGNTEKYAIKSCKHL